MALRYETSKHMLGGYRRGIVCHALGVRKLAYAAAPQNTRRIMRFFAGAKKIKTLTIG
jgi:hypothetical protein